MQGDRCAYCECDLSYDRRNLTPHIEHFRQRSRFPERTFDWGNLFWSCSKQDRCGKHKDTAALLYDDRLVVKPDEDDPKDFLSFSADGRVRPRSHLSGKARERAQETIRVFALDSPGLRGMRANRLRVVLKEWTDVVEAGFSESQLDEYFDSLLEQHSAQPFFGAVSDLLQRRPGQ